MYTLDAYASENRIEAEVAPDMHNDLHVQIFNIPGVKIYEGKFSNSKEVIIPLDRKDVFYCEVLVGLMRIEELFVRQ